MNKEVSNKVHLYNNRVLPNSTGPEKPDKEKTNLAVGMVVTSLNNVPVGRTYESVVQAISEMKEEEIIVLATSGHVRNVNTMERLANRLTLAARHVKACVITERDTRKKHIYFVNNHEEIMENIYRSFRTIETERVCGVRNAIVDVMNNGVSKCVEKEMTLSIESGRILFSIDTMIDFKVYLDFNARIKKYHDSKDQQMQK